MNNILTDETNSFDELREYILRYKHLISRTNSMIRAVNIIEKRFKNKLILLKLVVNDFLNTAEMEIAHRYLRGSLN